LCALVCAAAVIAAGCHRNSDDSGYGIGWVTLTGTPAPIFTAYIINVDSITLTGKNVGVITALATPETVDFTKLKNISELWGSASIPNDTYTQATITLDYTDAVIDVMVDGKPTLATVYGPGGTTVTTISVNVSFDPVNQPVMIATYATTMAERLAINFDLPASNIVDATASPPTVTVRPFVTAATSAPDNKPIRVRGPLINSSLGEDTYTVYVRPFYDEVNSIGSLSIFNSPSTLYTINGTTYVGQAGLNVLSQLSAGITVTAAYTTLKPTPTPSAIAGIFYSMYVVAGSTLEDEYTEGMEGDVIARSGNTLTLRGATLIENTADLTSYIATPDSQVLLAPGTIVTADGASSAGLDYNSVSVGQHITARGIYTLSAAGVTILDATGTSSTNTGSVRIQSTEAWGPLVSSSSGSLTMNLQTLNYWPASIFNFAGTGASTAQNASAANYVVDTGAMALPAGTVAGDPVWIDGVIGPFGAAPPDFKAYSVNNQASVQVSNVPAIAPNPATNFAPNPTTAGITTCGQGSVDCVPASLQVIWSGSGTATPFSTLTASGGGSMTIDLSNPNFVAATGVIRIGAESIALTSLPATPTIVPVPEPPTGTPGVAGTPGLPAIFMPLFTVGDPITSSQIVTTAPTSTTSTVTTTLHEYNSFASFVAEVNSLMSASTPAVQFEATGFYNQTTNTFNASSINVVL
jgi:hypothetical protein